MAGFVEMYCENLALSLKLLFSPSKVIESFPGYNSQGLDPWTFNICRTFRLSNFQEKSCLILIGMPLYITWPFSFATLNVLFLILYVKSFDYSDVRGLSSIQSICCLLYSCTFIGVYFFRLGKFSSTILLKMFFDCLS